MSTRNDEPARASRPFDRDRDGFVMGEGACVLVLEERTRALARGAPVYAEVLGFGFSNDAHHMTAPRPDGSQAARSMQLALDDGRVSAGEVAYVNAHGSSTPLNDPTETAAIKRVFGDHAARLQVSSTKAYYGHALGASGAIEAAICALALQREWLPPTLNLECARRRVRPGLHSQARARRARRARAQQFIRVRRDQRGARDATRRLTPRRWTVRSPQRLAL